MFFMLLFYYSKCLSENVNSEMEEELDDGQIFMVVWVM